MLIHYKTTYPLAEIRERIVNTLNGVRGIKATGEFIMTIPRHNLITIELDDDTSMEQVFEVGALCGALDYA